MLLNTERMERVKNQLCPSKKIIFIIFHSSKVFNKLSINSLQYRYKLFELCLMIKKLIFQFNINIAKINLGLYRKIDNSCCFMDCSFLHKSENNKCITI